MKHLLPLLLQIKKKIVLLQVTVIASILFFLCAIGGHALAIPSLLIGLFTVLGSISFFGAFFLADIIEKDLENLRESLQKKTSNEHPNEEV